MLAGSKHHIFDLVEVEFMGKWRLIIIVWNVSYKTRHCAYDPPPCEVSVIAHLGCIIQKRETSIKVTYFFKSQCLYQFLEHCIKWF